MFTKQFFQGIDTLVDEYYKRYPCPTFTLTIKAYDKEYNVEAILDKGEQLLAFAYYDTKKVYVQPPEMAKKKFRDSTALPLLVVPYEAIASVEFNPGDAVREGVIGFSPRPVDAESISH